MLSILLASTDHTIPYNAIDYDRLWPFIQDFIGKIGMFVTIGIGIFLAISGVYFLAKILYSHTH